MSDGRTHAAWIASSFAGCGLAVVASVAVTESHGLLRNFAIARGSGWIAIAALAIALCVTPVRTLRRALGWRELAWVHPCRRSFGIAAASCGLIHASFSFALVPGVRDSLFASGWLRAGVGALLLLSALLLTSFSTVLRRLRLQFWNELHWLAYPAAMLAALHTLLGPFGTPRLELALCTVIGSLIVLRFLPGRR